YLLGEESVRLAEGIDPAAVQLLFDPQTSGGLLFAVPPERAAELRERFVAAREPIWQIGEVTKGAGIEVNA
ncbi:selenophosphate synthase, partial [Kouleothrix aurantiaca]